MANRESEAKRQKEMLVLDNILLALKGYETSDPFGQRNAMNQKLALVQDQYALHPAWIPPNTLVLYYGSLLYGDPEKGDIDLTYISTVPANRNDHRQLELDIEKVVDPSQLLFDVIPLGIMPEINAVASNEKIRRSQKVHLQFAAECGAKILSAKPLFPQQREFQQSLQSEIRQLATENPFYRKEVTKQLNIVLANRKMKRGIN